MPAADRVAGDRSEHGLRQAADLHMQVADVEAADALLGDLVVAHVAVVAADPLVAAGAEGVVAGAGEDDRADARCRRGRRVKASRSSARVCGRNALRTSGRLIVIRAIASARS